LVIRRASAKVTRLFPKQPQQRADIAIAQGWPEATRAYPGFEFPSKNHGSGFDRLSNPLPGFSGCGSFPRVVRLGANNPGLFYANPLPGLRNIR